MTVEKDRIIYSCLNSQQFVLMLGSEVSVDSQTPQTQKQTNKKLQGKDNN